MARKIDPSLCVGCCSCKSECPVECIKEEGGVCVINADECVDCGTCEGACPVNAISAE